jgi:hypothetical protein
MIIFRVQNEINGHDRSADGDHGEDEIDQEHEPVDVVEFVGPEGGEDEIHFNENGTKGKDSRDRNDEKW